MNSGKMTSYEDIETFFKECQGTDFGYLRTHYARFLETFKFADLSGPDKKQVLDIGCHWLHLDYFFAKAGTLITACDAPNTLKQKCVIDAARKLNINLVEYRRLDLGEGLVDLADDTYDLVLMSEILEHLAFNPLVFWKQIFRVMKNGGKVIITTPNSVYYKSLSMVLEKKIYAAASLGLCRSRYFFYGDVWSSLEGIQHSRIRAVFQNHELWIFRNSSYCSYHRSRFKQRDCTFEDNVLGTHTELCAI